MVYSRRGTRKAGRVKLGEPVVHPDLGLIRSAVQHGVKIWGKCFLMMFPDGELMLRKMPPSDIRFFIACYAPKFRTADIRDDLHEAMAERGHPIPDDAQSSQNQPVALNAQECALDV